MRTVAEAASPPDAEEVAAPEVRLEVEYWTVSMEEQQSCDSCDDTFTALTDSVDTVRPLAERLGVVVDIVPRTVETWTEAVGHGIVASPTIRAAGIELRPVHPDNSEARFWEWRGATSSSVSSKSLLDFLIRALAVRSEQLNVYLADGGPAAYVRRFLRQAPRVETPEPASCGCGPSTCG
jgi:hypothetical protein